MPPEDQPDRLDEVGPVFILGCPRSGTTFLSDCVGAIRGAEMFVGILCPPRLCHAIATEDRPAREDLLLRSVRDIFWNSFLLRRRSRRDQISQVWHGRLSLFEYLFGRSARPGVFCYKEPFLCFAADKFARHFPAAKFVHIVRDGRDNADSLERTYPHGLSDAVLRDEALSLNKNSEIGDWQVVDGVRVPWWVAADEVIPFTRMSRFERCVLLWREMTQRARALASLGAERYYEVRYEDFVRDPKRQGQAMLDFLGQASDESFSLAIGQAFTKSIGVARRNQPADLFGRGTAIAHDLLKELGYDA